MSADLRTRRAGLVTDDSSSSPWVIANQSKHASVRIRASDWLQGRVTSRRLNQGHRHLKRHHIQSGRQARWEAESHRKPKWPCVGSPDGLHDVLGLARTRGKRRCTTRRQGKGGEGEVRLGVNRTPLVVDEPARVLNERYGRAVPNQQFANQRWASPPGSRGVEASERPPSAISALVSEPAANCVRSAFADTGVDHESRSPSDCAMAMVPSDSEHRSSVESSVNQSARSKSF